MTSGRTGNTVTPPFFITGERLLQLFSNFTGKNAVTGRAHAFLLTLESLHFMGRGSDEAVAAY